MAHLSEREAVFARTDLLAATLSWRTGAVTIGEAEQAVARLERAGVLHAANAPVPGDSLTTDKAIADEKETVALMERGRGASKSVMRSRAVGPMLHNGRLTEGQREAVKLILSSKDRTVGVQGYADTGKTTMLNRARALAEKSGYRVIGLAPSASAARTLGIEAGIESETLQRAGMKTAVMDEILRQKDAELKAAVRASLAGDVRGAFEKLGDRVAEVKPDNLAGAAAARWLGLSPEQRENTGLMVPSHELRQAVNGHIRDRLARDGAINQEVMYQIMCQLRKGVLPVVRQPPRKGAPRCHRLRRSRVGFRGREGDADRRAGLGRGLPPSPGSGGDGRMAEDVDRWLGNLDGAAARDRRNGACRRNLLSELSS